MSGSGHGALPRLCVQVCEGKLGLLCPMRPICFGLLSRGSHMSLLLPTHTYRILPAKEAPALRWGFLDRPRWASIGMCLLLGVTLSATRRHLPR